MSTLEDAERKKKIEEERRAKRKERIQGNIKNRIDFVSDRSNDLKPTTVTPIDNNNVFDDEEEEEEEEFGNNNNSNGNNGEIRKRRPNKSSENKGQPNQPNQTNNQQKQIPFTLENIFKKNRVVKEPFSFKTARFIGAFFYSAILISLTILMNSEELLSELKQFQTASIPTNKTVLNFFIGIVSDNGEYGRRLLLGAVAFSWFLWELILVLNNSKYTKQVTTSPVSSYLRRDILLLAFFYIIGLDISLRAIDTYEPRYNLDSQLISGLYPPLVISFIGSIIISIIPKYVSILQVNEIVGKLYNTIAHIVLLFIVLILCIDDWSCSSQFCKNQIFYYMLSKSRGLMLWSHICHTFMSNFV